MRLLFVKKSQAWPRSAGHDVHGYFMMRALQRLGHEVALLSAEPVSTAARAGLDLGLCRTFAETNVQDQQPPTLTRLQARYLSYWGVDKASIGAVRQTALDWQADAVVGVGLDALPYFAGVTGAVRVWYAADESVRQHLSQLSLLRRRSWGHLKRAAWNGLYERAFAPLVDRVWVVADGERRAMRWVTGLRDIDVAPNGVDCDHYVPQEVEPLPHSCTFWGRLDFGPNVQALEWFCRRVWPLVMERQPEARFTIYGFQPDTAVWRLAALPGVSVVPDVPDLRAGVAAHQVAVMPFVSGGGIKNKLLEAAALGKAILCTPRACGGLRGEEPLPLLRASGTRDWVDALSLLWDNPERCRQLGRDARHWVQTHHTWEATAAVAAAAIEQGRLRAASA